MNDLTNFQSTLRELKEYLSLPIQNNRDRAGIIQGFEFTFEQAWRAIQKRAGKEGSEIGSPKKAFTFAMENKWISLADEDKWLQLIKDRNLATHTYEAGLAIELIGRIRKEYLTMFEGLLQVLEKTK